MSRHVLLLVSCTALVASHCNTAAAAENHYRVEEGPSGSLVYCLPDSKGGPCAPAKGQVTYILTTPHTSSSFAMNLGAASSQPSVNVPSQFPFNLRQDGSAYGTVEFYVRPACGMGHQAIVWGRADNLDTNRWHVFYNANQTLGVDYRAPNGDLHSLVGAFNQGINVKCGVWSLLSMTFYQTAAYGGAKSGAGELRVYVNRALRALSYEARTDLPTSTSWMISGRNLFQFSGDIDEVRATSSVLSPDQFLPAPNQ